MKQEYFEIGQIVNTFGIKGFVKVNPFTDDMQRFGELNYVFVVRNKELLKMQIEEVKYHKNVVLVKFKGIEDINMAEQYKGCYIRIKREYARKLPKDTYFIADLIGVSVFDENDNFLGKVNDIYNNKVHDIYVIKDDLGKQILLPSTKEIIKQIDVENDRIVVHLIDGLV